MGSDHLSVAEIHGIRSFPLVAVPKKAKRTAKSSHRAKIDAQRKCTLFCSKYFHPNNFVLMVDSMI